VVAETPLCTTVDVVTCRSVHGTEHGTEVFVHSASAPPSRCQAESIRRRVPRVVVLIKHQWVGG